MKKTIESAISACVVDTLVNGEYSVGHCNKCGGNTFEIEDWAKRCTNCGDTTVVGNGLLAELGIHWKRSENGWELVEKLEQGKDKKDNGGKGYCFERRPFCCSLT